MPAYFPTITAILLTLSLVAFSDNLLTNVGQPSNKDPKFIVHGLFGLAWYVLLVIQANLIRVHNIRLHQTIGRATLLVTIGVTLSTLYLFIVKWKGWENMEHLIRMNRLLLPGFAVCMILAWQQRKVPVFHKRLVLVGTLFMLEPVLSRAYDVLVANWARIVMPNLYTEQVDAIGYEVFLWGSWLGFFVSLLVYDKKTLGKAHVVTACGLMWLMLVTVVCGIG